jgi:S-DNA-T family DNA segregation ATPase FtsK/SpoIIIE
MIGLRLNLLLANVLSGIGAFFVYLAGIFVGLIVFFDTSVDELVSILGGIMNIGGKLVPGKTVDYFKKKPSPLENKKMIIKGMQEKDMVPREVKINNSQPQVLNTKKDELLISDKLVMNTLQVKEEFGIYHHLDILSNESTQKADQRRR